MRKYILTLVILAMTTITRSSATSNLRALQSDNPPDVIPSFESSIPIVVALDYVSNETSTRLETGDLDDQIFRSFCDAVQEQAGGNQVRLAAVDAGVTIATRNNTLDCALLASMRAYSTGASMDSLFTLELQVSQIIFSSTTNLTSLASLVETGFNRGSGGRVRFRTLLHQSQPEFSTISDIRVIGQLSPPQMPPTSEPSMLPSQSHNPTPTPPSLSPSFIPTDLPSTTLPTKSPFMDLPTLSPTSTPSTGSPSAALSETPSLTVSVGPSKETASPSSTPSDTFDVDDTLDLTPEPSSDPATVGIDSTLGPSNIPSSNNETVATLLTPSASPSLPATLGPTVSPIHMDQDVQTSPFTPAVIAAMVGSILAVLVLCCFVIYCCAGKLEKDVTKTDEEYGDEDIRQGRKRNLSAVNKSSVPVLPIVPEVVQLDEDHMSLANTTLGEHTAGRKPPKKKRLIQFESFDETSLYTTPGLKAILPGREISEDSANNIGNLPVSKMTPQSKVNTTSDKDPAKIGVSIDYEDDVFFEENDEEALLGAKGFHSPIANKIEDMISEELGPPSVSSSSTSFELPVSPEADSPMTMLRHQVENVIIARDDSSEAETTRDDFVDGQTSMSSDTRSSVTNKIGNVSMPVFPTTRPSMGTYSVDSTPSSNRSEVSTPQSAYATPDAPGQYSLLSSKKKLDYDSHVGLHQKMHQQAEYLVDTSFPESDQFVPFTPTKTPVSTFDNRPRSAASPESRSTAITPQTNTSENRDVASPSIITPPTVRVVNGKDITDSGVSTPLCFKSPAANGSEYSGSTKSLTASSKSTPMFSNTGTLLIPSPMTSRKCSPTPSVVGESNGLSSPSSSKSESTFRSHSPASLKTVESRTQVEVAPASPHGTIESEDWLMDAVEGTLGPRSASADLESLAGKSLDGASSKRSQGSKKKRRNSMGTFATEEKSEDSTMTPRTFEHDLHRLELQLAMLKTEVNRNKQSRGSSKSSTSLKTRINSKKRVVVVAPPGKLGVILANRKDGSGTVISEVRPTSALNGSLLPGDKLVAVDGQDVTGMVVSDITRIMKKHADQERRLTVITSFKNRGEGKSNSP